MITKGDEYPIHQTPEPIAYAGTDRNFYDRYFFNGYSKTTDIFFSMALGVYPHLNVKDAAFCVVVDGVQHNLRSSAILGMERMDIQVGPMDVDVVEPLRVIRIRAADNEYGISADLTFTLRSPIVEEPRFTKRVAARTIMDITRMTQNGSWSGFIDVQGERIDVSDEEFVGTRDRSWGVRNIGSPDPQPLIPHPEHQFFWYWAPLNFDNHVTMFGLNENADGSRWHSNGMIIPRNFGEQPPRYRDIEVGYHFRGGTRFQDSMTLRFSDPDLDTVSIQMTPRFHFYMSGLGYTHPDWGHGCYKGDLVVAYDRLTLADVDPTNPLYFHVQAIVDAEMDYQGSIHHGAGVLEQMVFGRHEPSGLMSSNDMAPDTGVTP